MGFREEFLKFKQPSPQREQFVYNSAIKTSKSEITSTMKPIEVKRPNGDTAIFEVMPDYFKIEGMRVPMAGVTAQRVADYFGLRLPTPQVAEDIYKSANIRFSAKPLSGSGTTVGDKKYTGKQVVEKGVGYSHFVQNYNEVIDKQLSSKDAKPGDIVAGFAKDVTAPAPGAEKKLGLYGLHDSKGKPIQGGSGQTPHDTVIHSEYGSYARFISPIATLIKKDGTRSKVKIEEVYAYTRYDDKDTIKPGKEKYEPLISDKKQPAMSKVDPLESKSKPTDSARSSSSKLPQSSTNTTSSKLSVQNTTSTTGPHASVTKEEKDFQVPLGKIDEILNPIKLAFQERRDNIIKRSLKLKLLINQ